MLNRDFTKSNKDYFNKNKIALIIIAAFLIVGIVIGSFFGMRGNFEIAGCNEFTVTVGTDSSNYNDYIEEIQNVVNSYGGNFDTASVYGEGDDTKLVIRYMTDLSQEDQLEINEVIVERLSIDAGNISSHVSIAPTVRNVDYIYTAVAILLLIAVASIFAYFRYNGASAMTIIISTILGTLAFMSIGAILRLTIGMSYFAMLVILNMLIVYSCFDVFENIRETSWLQADDYSNAIKSGMRSARFKQCAISIAVLLIGLLFVIFAPSALKYVSLNIMFIAVVTLAVSCYVLPFVWSVFITHCKKREFKVKVKKESENNTSNNEKKD